MRRVIPALLLVAAAFAAGVFWTKTDRPAVQASPAAAPAVPDDAALASVRKETQLLRSEIAVLANEVAALRAALQDRPATAAPAVVVQAQPENPDPTATKPTKDALERYRTATGNSKPASPEELVPYFTDPRQAESFLKNREAAAAKPERQQLKAELKTELKQRLKSGAGADPAPAR